MTAASAIEYQVTSGDLVTELAAHAKVEGANAGAWPGLTFYRFSRPTEPYWDNGRTVSIGIVAQTSDDTFTCVVIGKWPRGARQAFDASPERPCLCVRLEVDPRLVGQVAASMMLCDGIFEISDHSDDCVVSGVDGVLMSSVVRFSCTRCRWPPIVRCSPRCTCRSWCTSCCSVIRRRDCCASPPGRAP